jgi:hypothetical protein
VSSLPSESPRDFAEVHRDLEAILWRLKSSRPESKRKLLRELRLLLQEADVILESGINV